MPDAPDTHRDAAHQTILTLLTNLVGNVRQWAEAEAILARTELGMLRQRLVTIAILGVVAAVVLFVALIILAQTGVAALALYLDSPVEAGAIVGVVLLVICGICAYLIKRQLSWPTDSLLFSWMSSSARRGRSRNG